MNKLEEILSNLNYKLTPISSFESMNAQMLFMTKYGAIKKSLTELKRGRGISIRAAIDKNQYAINLLNDIHNHKYDYSKFKYKGSYNKISVICPNHGEFKIQLSNHTQGQGCGKCSRENHRLTYEELNLRLDKAIGLDKYTLENFNPKDLKSKIKITCNVHGSFIRRLDLLLEGHGCSKCSKLNRKGKSKTRRPLACNYYYNSKRAEVNKAEWLEKPAKLYLLKLEGDKEQFYKIGITTLTMKARLKHIRAPYTVEVLDTIESNLYNAVIMEEKLLVNNSEHKYIPKNYFTGYTECFIKKINL